MKRLSYMNASEIDGLDDEFWGMFSFDAPFSWADNDYSLITAERFSDHAHECMTHHEDITDKERDEFCKNIRELGLKTLINLEA